MTTNNKPDSNEQPDEALEQWPTDAQLSQAGITRDVWNDPESWDSEEYAFFWEHEAREVAERDLAARAELAELFQVPASWATILPAIRRSCASIATVGGDALARIEAVVDTASEERYQSLREWEQLSERWKSEGDMYGWNFHQGMAAGANYVDIYYRQVTREIKAIREAAASSSATPAQCDCCDRPTAYLPACKENGKWIHRSRDNEAEPCTSTPHECPYCRVIKTSPECWNCGEHSTAPAQPESESSPPCPFEPGSENYWPTTPPPAAARVAAGEVIAYLFDDYPDNSDDRDGATQRVAAIIARHLSAPETTVAGEAQKCVKRDDVVRRAKDWLNQYQLDRHYEGMERVFHHVARIVQDLLSVLAHAHLIRDTSTVAAQARALADAVNTDYRLDDGSYVEDELRHQPLSEFVVDTLLDFVKHVCESAEPVGRAPVPTDGDDEGEALTTVQAERERIRSGVVGLRPFGSGDDCTCERCETVNAVLALVDNETKKE